MHQNPKDTTKTSPLKTALGALFGIQSEAKRKEDFSQKDPVSYVVLGVITVVLLLVGMATFVRAVLD